MKKEFCDRPFYNPVLITAINDYGRDNFVRETGLSKGMVDGVCTGRRRFGPKKAREIVAPTLELDKSQVRPDLWA